MRLSDGSGGSADQQDDVGVRKLVYRSNRVLNKRDVRYGVSAILPFHIVMQMVCSFTTWIYAIQ